MTDKNHDRITRRRLLRTASQGAAAASLAALNPCLLSAPTTQPTTQPTGLPHTTFGRTGHPVTRISFGTILLQEPQGPRVLKLAIDRGINLLHTSETYNGGKSIRAIGALFRSDKRYREKVFLCLKGRNPPNTDEVDRMLKILGVPRADILFTTLHKPSLKRLDDIRKQQDRLIRAKKIRFRGFVCHLDMNGAIELVLDKAADDFDAALLAMTMIPVPGGRSTEAAEAQTRRFVKNLKALHEKNIGILSMKSGARKAVQEGPDVFRAHVMTVLEAGADSILTSMDTFQQVDMVTRLDLASPPTQAERKTAAAFRNRRADACLMCGQCNEVCPHHLPISDLMRCRLYHAEYGWHEHARAEYAALGLDAHRLAAACGDCTACTEVCPVSLASAATVRQVADWLA